MIQFFVSCFFGGWSIRFHECERKIFVELPIINDNIKCMAKNELRHMRTQFVAGNLKRGCQLGDLGVKRE